MSIKFLSKDLDLDLEKQTIFKDSKEFKNQKFAIEALSNSFQRDGAVI